MHPYYGSDRLVSASPTLIESVETQETEMITPNNGTGSPGQMPPNHPGAVPTMGLGINSSPISATGVHDSSQYAGVQYPMLSPQLNPTFPGQYQPTPVITRNVTHSSGQVYGLPGPAAAAPIAPTTTSSDSGHGYGVYGIAGSHSGPSNGYLPTTSLPYIPVATSSTPYLPVATSTPFVQFATPNFTTSESLYTYTNKGYTPQVSFHFQSPTFSTPPIQMMAPHSPQADSRGTPLSWQHTLPTSLPWATTSAATIHFTATDTLKAQSSTTMANSTSNSKQGYGGSIISLLKRKSSSNDGGLPEKVHVNEERMAARLEELHLDNNNLQWHPDLEDQWYTQRPPPPGQDDNDDSEKEVNQVNAAEVNPHRSESGNSSRRLNMTGLPLVSDDDAEKEKENQVHAAGVSLQGPAVGNSSMRLNFTELLKIGIKSQEMLPKLIMDEITKPCMQVVLWKPPGNFVKELVKETPHGAISVTPPADGNGEINDVDSPASDTSGDIMEITNLSAPSSSWLATSKNDIDDMEL